MIPHERHAISNATTSRDSPARRTVSAARSPARALGDASAWDDAAGAADEVLRVRIEALLAVTRRHFEAPMQTERPPASVASSARPRNRRLSG